MQDKKDSNTENNIKQRTTNVTSGNISNSTGVIIGSNIHVEGRYQCHYCNSRY